MTPPALTPLDGGRIKKSRASLIGGMAVGVFVLALWVAILRDIGASGAGPVALGVVTAALIGLWIWRADL